MADPDPIQTDKKGLAVTIDSIESKLLNQQSMSGLERGDRPEQLDHSNQRMAGDQDCASGIEEIRRDGVNSVLQDDEQMINLAIGQEHPRLEPAKCTSELGRPKVWASLISRYNRERLYEDIWKSPMKDVAKKYGVSDVALGKTCRRLYIPIPPQGYWNKVAANKPVETRPNLPAVEVLSTWPHRKGKLHSVEEAKVLSQEIQHAISLGTTLKAACRRAQIDLNTFLRWRKRNNSGEPLVASKSRGKLP
jgi:hypothetical protein